MDGVVYFDWPEFFASKTAKERDIVNYPEPSEVERVNRALLALAARVMDVIRAYVGVPVYITSGYRCKRLNELVGGVAASQHTKGEACDFTVPSFSAQQMQKLYYNLATWLEYDQLIYYPRKNMIHVSYRSVAENRHHTFISGKR